VQVHSQWLDAIEQREGIILKSGRVADAQAHAVDGEDKEAVAGASTRKNQ
jgi:hypothetical protein